ncbi:MAG: NepR family anti-sigma factor [Pseudomonadota bacterium]
MSSGSSSGETAPDQSEAGPGSPRPDWADGLRQLYDSVVDEPLPDTFKDLLEQLDDSGLDDHGCDAAGSDGGQS